MTEKTLPRKKPRLQIDTERCKGCLLCVDACPFDCLGVTDKVNKKGFRYISLTPPEKCTDCGVCVIMCPDCVFEIPSPQAVSQ